MIAMDPSQLPSGRDYSRPMRPPASARAHIGFQRLGADFEVTTGYLGRLGNTRAWLRRRYARYFVQCDAWVDLAGRLAGRLCQLPLKPHEVMAVALWIRSLTAAQSAILLAERGMPPEAAAMLRGALEHLFAACAVLARPQRIENLKQLSLKLRGQQRAIFLDHEMIAPLLTDEDRRNLAAIEAHSNLANEFSAYEASRDADLGLLYDTVYRGTSRVGVHAGLESANFSIQHNRLAYGPIDEELPMLLDSVVQSIGQGFKRFWWLDALLTRDAQQPAANPSAGE